MLLALLSFKAEAQKKDKKITDLLFLYADEKYDKLVYKSTSLTENDKYKRHPLPYIYLAMGYYEMSRKPDKFSVGERDSDFPKPLKSAEKYLYKYLKVEKKAKKYFPDYESSYNDYTDFYEAIADTANKLGQTLFLMDKPRKAASVYKNAYKAVPTNPVLLLWEGITEVKSKNTVEGDKNIITALNKIDENYKPVKSTAGVLAHGMLIIEEYLTQKGDVTNARKAKKLVDVFKKYDPDELDKEKMEARKEKAQRNKDEIMRKFYSDKNDKENIEREKGSTIVPGSDVKKSEDELDKLEREASGGNKKTP